MPARALAVLLLPVLATSPSAQSPVLDAVALPTRLEASVTGVPAGAAVVLVLGLHAQRIELPGLVLGVTPDVVGGLAVADADGEAWLTIELQREACAGLACFAQAVAVAADLLPVTTGVQAVRVPDQGEAASVYVLFGQSNAEGHAPVEQLPAELRRPQLRSRVWNLGPAAFEPLAASVNGRTLTSSSLCGPELSFAQALSSTGSTIYLVKVAVDQTALGPTPGPMNEWGAEAGELYALLRGVIDDACAELRAQGLLPRVRGVAMMQGESDATGEAWAAGYEARLLGLVRHLRLDLASAGLAGGSDVPFVMGLIDKLLPADVFPWVTTVRDAQCAVASVLPACAVVETTGIPLLADDTHFDAAGVTALGLALAVALQAMH